MKDSFKLLSSIIRHWKKGVSRRTHYSVAGLAADLKAAGFKAAPLNKAERDLYNGTCKFCRVIIAGRVLYVARNGGTERLIRSTLEFTIVGACESSGNLSRRSKDKCAGYRCCRMAYLSGLIWKHKAIFARIGAAEETFFAESETSPLTTLSSDLKTKNTKASPAMNRIFSFTSPADAIATLTAETVRCGCPFQAMKNAAGGYMLLGRGNYQLYTGQTVTFSRP